MAATTFNFIERYRTLAPAAAREVVEARQQAYTKLLADSTKMSHAYALISVAFQLNRTGNYITDWFGKTVHDLDEQFILNIDKAEAARVASLLLEENMSRKLSRVAVAILAASFCGRRSPAPDTTVLQQAKIVLESAGKLRQAVRDSVKLEFTSADELKTILATMETTLTGTNAKAAIESVLGQINAVVESLRSATRNALTSARSTSITMAEEIDMLWWNMGAWSECANKPLAKIPKASLAILAGWELGSFVSDPPGPYGAYGILRHALGDPSRTTTTLKNAVGELGKDSANLLTNMSSKINALMPVTSALVHAATHGDSNWEAVASSIGDVLNTEVSLFELAVQAYRERAVYNLGGIEE